MMQTLAAGTLLHNGTYRIEQVLGQGGFGITYLATDLNLQRLVAIKEFFPKEYCERDETTSHVSLGTKNTADFVNKLKGKFLKEARNIAKFDHPNIIRIHAAFEENNTAYYVMEYIEGESLSSMVHNNGKLPEKSAVGYIAQVGGAVDYIRKAKVDPQDVN
ncbi:MAG: protein kinase, partial [Muribaculaceae bacterium]|nr:protein kinase [Muribaculaceae bacterium]